MRQSKSKNSDQAALFGSKKSNALSLASPQNISRLDTGVGTTSLSGGGFEILEKLEKSSQKSLESSNSLRQSKS